MSMIMRDEEHDDFASGSHNNDSDDDRSSTESGTHEFAGGQEFIAIDNSELSERAAGKGNLELIFRLNANLRFFR